MKKKNIVKIDKKDFFRAVLTDTAPSDVPIIFSNDGLYINHHKTQQLKNSSTFNIIKSLYLNIISPIENTTLTTEAATQSQKKQSHPLKYKIIKNNSSLRTLSLIHPRAQKNYTEFYKEYGDAIISLCSLSPFSIRAPQKVGGSFYSKNTTPLNQYKEINIDTLENELHRKHASSFFAYRGYDRIYKLYNSSTYLNLEKQFSSMWLLDIANCFQSIYTHTISWAIKNKDHIKKYVSFRSQFCQEFDTLIQRSNNNETNGIPVGAEVSRIFSEIILQDIDINVIEALKKIDLHVGRDYTILRYVDDYVLFSKSDSTSELVFDTISDQLASYNLHISESKLRKYNRPFCTEKSQIIIGIKAFLDDLEKNLFNVRHIDEHRVLFPKKIYREDRFTHSFIEKVKALIKDTGRGYSEVSAYLVSILSKRAIDLTIGDKYNFPENKHEHALILRDAILITLNLTFFFYSVNPTVSSSNRLSKTILIIDRFIQKNYPDFLDFVRTEIMTHVNLLKFHREKNDERNGYISLERLNIILATSEFGDKYLISSSNFSYLEKDEINITYFDIVSLLYYFKSHKEYDTARCCLIKIAKQRLTLNFNLHQDSESAHTFLDLVCCPYLDSDTRGDLLSIYLTAYEKNLTVNPGLLETALTELSNSFWFVKWKNLDLIKLLERKELKSIY